MPEQNNINVLRGRKISLEGASVIGTGAAGQVYLLPDDNVVKVLHSTDFKEAENEILLSKWAFSKGLPTAISYDIVDVDGHPGLVYESLGRDNLRNRLKANPDNLEPVLKKYLAYIKDLNAITVDEGQLPSSKEIMKKRIGGIKHYFSAEEYDKVMALIATIPEDNHLIHGDCHIKNIKVVKDQLFLIDLETLSYGDPIFELGGLCCCYHAYVNNDGHGYDLFFDIDCRIIDKTYEYILYNYFPKLSEKEVKDNIYKIELFTYINMLAYLNPVSDKEAHADMFRRVRERLFDAKDFILKR